MNLKPNKNLLKISLFLIVGLFSTRDFNLEVKADVVNGGIFDSRSEKVCVFGDDIDETKWKGPEKDENAKVSCYYNFDKCKTTIPGIANVTLYCLPKTTGYKELWNDTTSLDPKSNSLFYKCTGAARKKSDFYRGTPDIEIESKAEGWLSTYRYNYVKSIDYKFEVSMVAAVSCVPCESNFSSSCNLIKSTCSIDLTTKTCNFGADSATNCVATISANVNKKKEGSFTYFCSANSRLVQCNGDRTTSKYSDILESSYSQIKSGSSCRFYTSTSGTQTCKLKNTSSKDNTCQFGPATTQNSTSNPLYKSCPDDTSEGTTTVNGRFIYCSPSNIKVSCTSTASYKELFNPDELKDDNTGLKYYDYSGKSLTDIAKTEKGCELVTTSIKPKPGCSVTSSSKVGDECSIPKDCFNDSNQPTRVSLGGVYNNEGGLYCINKGDGKADKGTVHFCQATITGSGSVLKSYSQISEIKTVSGLENVYFKSGGSTSCSASPTIYAEVKLRKSNPLSPIGLIKNIASFLYYFAIFYFIVLILINAFSYVRSGEDPSKLKQINESLFNTIAGFIFVLASGGVILYIINSFQ